MGELLLKRDHCPPNTPLKPPNTPISPPALFIFVLFPNLLPQSESSGQWRTLVCSLEEFHIFRASDRWTAPGSFLTLDIYTISSIIVWFLRFILWPKVQAGKHCSILSSCLSFSFPPFKTSNSANTNVEPVESHLLKLSQTLYLFLILYLRADTTHPPLSPQHSPNPYSILYSPPLSFFNSVVSQPHSLFLGISSDLSCCWSRVTKLQLYVLIFCNSVFSKDHVTWGHDTDSASHISMCLKVHDFQLFLYFCIVQPDETLVVVTKTKVYNYLKFVVYGNVCFRS